MKRCTGFIVFVTILFWVGNREMRNSKSLYESFSHRYKATTRWIQESVNSISNTSSLTTCERPPEAVNYTLCNRLPFTNTSCGTDGPYHIVPNIVHYVWLGDNHTFKFYHYLSVRSVASVQKPTQILFHINSTGPVGELWERAKQEVPCLHTQFVEAPTSIYGNEVTSVIQQTDIVRNLILMRYGGIYLDSDAIVLKSLDPLRDYKFSIGRSTEFSLSNSVMLSERHPLFLTAWTDLYKNFDKNKIKGIREAEYGIKVPFKLHLARPGLACHVEETSLQRPNPWIDGRACITHGNFDISQNYILHLHPSKSLKKDPTVLLNFDEDKLRKLDTTYGEGARIALFGTSDLIFLSSESAEAKNRLPTQQFKKFKNVETYKPDTSWSPFP